MKIERPIERIISGAMGSALRGIMAAGIAMITIANAQSADGGIYVPGPNNGLTAAQVKDGYQLLWNGKDFTGWKTYQQAAPGTNWGIYAEAGKENGAKKSLAADSNVMEVLSAGESIWTTDTTFQNFDLMVEWQTTPGESQNGGLLYRFSEKTSKDNNASAPEYQVCNDKWVSEWNVPVQTAGSLYELKPLPASRLNLDKSPSWTRAAGHWNQSRIIAYGGRLAHFGNGLKLVEDQMLTPDWNTRYKASKYGKWPYFATIHPGSIFLQDHGQANVKYRNVRIKKLTESPWGPKSPYLNKVAAAAGDSALIDTITFATDLFPADGVPTLPHFAINAIAPKLDIRSNSQGITVFTARPGDYTVRLHDLRGADLSIKPVRAADGIFIPAASARNRGILSIWKGDRKVEEKLLGLP